MTITKDDLERTAHMQTCMGLHEAQEDIKRLRAALKWFADPDNYADGNVEVDGLAVARAALKESEGE